MDCGDARGRRQSLALQSTSARTRKGLLGKVLFSKYSATLGLAWTVLAIAYMGENHQINSCQRLLHKPWRPI